MAKLKEKTEYAAMRVSGFLGWLHRIVMLITFPIRKFWIIAAVAAVLLVILISVPLSYGIPGRDIWDWYMVKMPAHEFVEAKDKVLFDAKNKIKQVAHTLNEIVPDKMSDKELQKNKKAEKTQFVAWNVAEFRKAKYKPKKKQEQVQKAEKQKDINKDVLKDNAFETAKNTKEVEQIIPEKTEKVYAAPQKSKDSAANEPETVKEDNQKAALASQIAEQKAAPAEYEGSLQDYYTKYKSKDLSYLKTPEIIKGDAKVIGPNSMYVNGRFLFLYGIYSHPRRHDVDAAAQYLHSMIQGKKVYCEAVAYSQKTQSATALCFVNGVLINKALAEHNLAQNVALK